MGSQLGHMFTFIIGITHVLQIHGSSTGDLLVLLDQTWPFVVVVLGSSAWLRPRSLLVGVGRDKERLWELALLPRVGESLIGFVAWADRAVCSVVEVDGSRGSCLAAVLLHV